MIRPISFLVLFLLAQAAVAAQSSLDRSSEDKLGSHFYKNDMATVFERAVDAVILLDWKLKSKNPDAGVIVANTPRSMRSFGDKVTILVSKTGDGRVRVDLSSKSKMGAGGLGKNKKNIRLFYDYLDDMLGVDQ